MAAFVQMPVPMNSTFSRVPWQSNTSLGVSSSSLAKPAVRRRRHSRRNADTNTSRTILYGRPSTAQGEVLPPYSLDRDLPVYTTANLQSQSEPGKSAVPKYLSIFVICTFFLPSTKDMWTKVHVCRVSPIWGLITKPFVPSHVTKSRSLTAVADWSMMEDGERVKMGRPSRRPVIRHTGD